MKKLEELNHVEYIRFFIGCVNIYIARCDNLLTEDKQCSVKCRDCVQTENGKIEPPDYYRRLVSVTARNDKIKRQLKEDYKALKART